MILRLAIFSDGPLSSNRSPRQHCSARSAPLAKPWGKANVASFHRDFRPASIVGRGLDRGTRGRISDDVIDIEITKVDAADRKGLQAIADLHSELMAFGPMAALGNSFIRDVCYRAQIQGGFLRTALCRVDGRPAGFVAYTAHSISFHRAFLRSNWLTAVWGVFWTVLADPRRLYRLLRALRIVVSRRAEARIGIDPLGEVVALAVRPEYLTQEFKKKTGVWLSERLVSYVIAYLRRSGVSQMRMLVDEDNAAPLLVYHLMGARFEEYEQAGEPTTQVWFDIDVNAGERDQDVPPCWCASAGGAGGASNGESPDDWSTFWEKLVFDQHVFRAEAEDYVARILAFVPLSRDASVFDFGCGLGLVAELLAPQVRSMTVWDKSAAMRWRARLNLATEENVQYLHSRWIEDPPRDLRFDLIIVNSVAQYMSHEEFEELLWWWRGVLDDGGRILVSDVLHEGVSPVKETLALLLFSWRRKIFFRSLYERLPRFVGYWKRRAQVPLSSYERPVIAEMAKRADLEHRILEHSVTLHPQRLSVVFWKPGCELG